MRRATTSILITNDATRAAALRARSASEGLPGVQPPRPSRRAHRVLPALCRLRTNAAAALISLATLCLLSASPARAQPDPSGITFVTVGSPNNAPWTGGGLYVNNRGSVPYTYRIGQYEVTTSQWAQFMNAAFDRPAGDSIPFVHAPTAWGASSTTPTNSGGRHWTVPTTNGMLPVGGIDWRTAAIYCNWLTNGMSTDRSAFLSGAYEVSTFGYYNGQYFTDQLTHSPGAQYWIPTIDEWMKAAYYDPNKNGQGQGGWWAAAYQSDTQPVYGPTGYMVNGHPTTANSGDLWFAQFPGQDPYSVQLGAYNVTSAFGLYDTAGGTSEWTEGYHQIPGEPYPRERLYEGSSWDFPTAGADMTRSLGGEYPSFVDATLGLRIASTVPSPSALGSFAGMLVLTLRRRRAAVMACHFEVPALRDFRWV